MDPVDDRNDAPPSAITSSRTALNALQSDAPLLRGLRDGDVSAFDSIVRLYSSGLKEYAKRMIENSDAAEDIVQDVFVWLWEHRDTLEVRGTLRSYLYGSVRNHTLTALRRARLEERCAVDFLHAPTLPGAGTGAIRPDTAIEQQELAQSLAGALGQLSPRVRQVALLRWRDQLSRSEIAVVLGVALPTVNNQLTVAARVLRQLLAGEKKS